MAWIRACGGGSPAVPDGRTVTPINDVTIWQKCAGIANPTYTTLAEVLADTGILQTLMASDNAVDYLARSKQFIGNDALVPAMTSNTTPSGEVLYSSYNTNGNKYPWYAFDRTTNEWRAANATYSGYIGYQFTSPVVANAIVYTQNYSESTPRMKTFVVQAYDGTDWIDLTSTITAETTSGEHTYSFANGTAYSKYRLSIAADINAGIQELQFVNNAIVQNSNAMTYIGQNNYASNTLLADSDWCSAICNSAYVDSILNVKVPKMTSNTTPSGIASASTNYNSNYPAWYAFDEDATTAWAPVDAMNNEWVKYKFTKNVTLKAVALKMSQPIADIKTRIGTFYVKDASDNILYSISTDAMTSNEPVFPIVATNNSDTIKLEFSKKTSSGLSVATLQFYGREDV